MSRPVQYSDKARAMRAKMLGRGYPQPKRIDIDGETWLIRVPTVAEADELQSAMMAPTLSKEGKPDIKKLRTSEGAARAAVLLTVDDAGGPVFEPTDVDQFLAAPVGDWMQKLAGAALLVASGKDPSAVDEEKEPLPLGEVSAPAL